MEDPDKIPKPEAGGEGAKKSEFDLLRGFFKFVVEFPCHKSVVCPHLGKLVPRNDFESQELACGALKEMEK